MSCGLNTVMFDVLFAPVFYLFMYRASGFSIMTPLRGCFGFLRHPIIMSPVYNNATRAAGFVDAVIQLTSVYLLKIL